MTREEASAALLEVFPELPATIDRLIGSADARIMSRADLRRLLAEFAVDVLWITWRKRKS